MAGQAIGADRAFWPQQDGPSRAIEAGRPFWPDQDVGSRAPRFRLIRLAVAIAALLLFARMQGPGLARAATDVGSTPAPPLLTPDASYTLGSACGSAPPQ